MQKPARTIRMSSLLRSGSLRLAAALATEGESGSSSEAEYESECVIDHEELGRGQPAGAGAEPLGVDDGDLFDEDPRFGVADCDRWAKSRCPRAGGGRSDDDGREAEKLVGLDHDRVAGAALLMPARLARARQAIDLPANHSVGRGRRQRRHLFTDERHFGPVAGVLGELGDLVPDR